MSVTDQAPPTTRLGKMLLDARLARGLSRERLTKRLDTSHTSVRRWEIGDSVPQFDALVALADELGLDINALADAVRLDARTQEVRTLAD